MWAWDGGVQAGPGDGMGCRLRGRALLACCRFLHATKIIKAVTTKKKATAMAIIGSCAHRHPGADERPITDSQRQRAKRYQHRTSWSHTCCKQLRGLYHTMPREDEQPRQRTCIIISALADARAGPPEVSHAGRYHASAGRGRRARTNGWVPPPLGKLYPVGGDVTQISVVVLVPR